MLAKLTRPCKEFGVLAGCLYLLDRILSRLSSHLRIYVYDLMVQPIPDKRLIPERLTAAMEFRLIEEGDHEIERMPARDGIIAARFGQGAMCLGAYQKSELIGYIWFATDSYDEDEVRCVFEISPRDESVFDFDLYLFPKHRLGLGFVSLWDGANRFLRQRGVRYTFSRLTRFNTASRRAHNHLGWRRVGRAVFLKLWALELMVADRRPWVSLTATRSARVRMTLTPDALAATVT